MPDNTAPGKRRRILAGNWKMNHTPIEALSYFSEYFSAMAKHPKSAPSPSEHRVIFPPAYTLGEEVQKAATRAQIELGAQNMHWEDKGAFTGELSGKALLALGIRWVLIGHSERRQYFGETDESAARRLRKALSLGLNTVFCLGETLREREAGQMEAVLARQAQVFIDAIAIRADTDKNRPVCALAYEPVWAIGTGKTATEAQAESAQAFLRELLAKGLDRQTAEQTPILYGGSVTPENARILLSLPNIDGVLVGGASLKPDSFAAIVGP